MHLADAPEVGAVLGGGPDIPGLRRPDQPGRGSGHAVAGVRPHRGIRQHRSADHDDGHGHDDPSPPHGPSRCRQRSTFTLATTGRASQCVGPVSPRVSSSARRRTCTHQLVVVQSVLFSIATWDRCHPCFVVGERQRVLARDHSPPISPPNMLQTDVYILRAVDSDPCIGLRHVLRDRCRGMHVCQRCVACPT